MILAIPFSVRHDFVAFSIPVKFLTHKLAFSVGSTVVGIAAISIKSNILWQVPHCRQAPFSANPRQPSVKQHFHFILQRCFSFPLSLSCIRSDDVKVFSTVIEINLLFSPRSFVDNAVGLLGRQYNDLVVVNHCLEFVDFRYPTETLGDTSLLMQLLSDYTFDEMIFF